MSIVAGPSGSQWLTACSWLAGAWDGVMQGRMELNYHTIVSGRINGFNIVLFIETAFIDSW